MTSFLIIALQIVICGDSDLSDERGCAKQVAVLQTFLALFRSLGLMSSAIWCRTVIGCADYTLDMSEGLRGNVLLVVIYHDVILGFLNA